MGELYNPYPNLPKNIRQIGERDPIVKLYVEDYVNTYLTRLYPAGGQNLRAGLLLGEARTQDGTICLFVDGALEMEGLECGGERVELTEEAWKRAYRTMEEMFPRREVLGWFLCGAPGSALSPLNYWKQHGQYFSAKNQLMYLNSGLEGEEAVYTASGDGFYKLRGYCIFYEKNQMMQDYMVSRKDAGRVEAAHREAVIDDFRQRMEDKKEAAGRHRSAVSVLGTACGVLAVVVLAGGVVSFGNYRKMKEMESVIASVLPAGVESADKVDPEAVGIEAVPGEVYPTLAEIVIETEAGAAEAGAEVGAAGGVAGAAEAGVEVGVTEGVAGAAEAGTEVGVAGSMAGAAEAGSAGGMAASSAGGGTDAAGGTGNSAAAAGAGGWAGGTGNSAAAGGAADTRPTIAAEPVQVPADAVLYEVQNGETLYGICMERYHSVNLLETICQWNGLTDQDRIAAGQKLYLPPN